jgi:hypothetical protein
MKLGIYIYHAKRSHVKGLLHKSLLSELPILSVSKYFGNNRNVT